MWLTVQFLGLVSSNERTLVHIFRLVHPGLLNPFSASTLLSHLKVIPSELHLPKPWLLIEFGQYIHRGMSVPEALRSD